MIYQINFNPCVKVFQKILGKLVWTITNGVLMSTTAILAA